MFTANKRSYETSRNNSVISDTFKSGDAYDNVSEVPPTLTKLINRPKDVRVEQILHKHDQPRNLDLIEVTDD